MCIYIYIYIIHTHTHTYNDLSLPSRFLEFNDYLELLCMCALVCSRVLSCTLALCALMHREFWVWMWARAKDVDGSKVGLAQIQDFKKNDGTGPVRIKTGRLVIRLERKGHTFRHDQKRDIIQRLWVSQSRRSPLLIVRMCSDLYRRLYLHVYFQCYFHFDTPLDLVPALRLPLHPSTIGLPRALRIYMYVYIYIYIYIYVFCIYIYIHTYLYRERGR